MMSSVYYRGISWTSIYYWEFEDTEENKLTSMPIFNECISLVEKYIEEGFPGGAVVEKLPANAGTRVRRPGLGRSHMPRSN